MFVDDPVTYASCHSSLSVTECAPAAMSEAVETSRVDGFRESSRAVGARAASLNDGAVDTAKYVHVNTFTLKPLSGKLCFPSWVLEEGVTPVCVNPSV